MFKFFKYNINSNYPQRTKSVICYCCSLHFSLIFLIFTFYNFKGINGDFCCCCCYCALFVGIINTKLSKCSHYSHHTLMIKMYSVVQFQGCSGTYCIRTEATLPNISTQTLQCHKRMPVCVCVCVVGRGAALWDLSYQHICANI